MDPIIAIIKTSPDLNRTQKRELKRVTAASREMKKLATAQRPNHSGVIFYPSSLVSSREGGS